MAYQFVARNSSGELLADSLIGVRLSIRLGDVVGQEIYAETHIVTANANGLLSVMIGSGNVLLGNFSSIAWESGSFFQESQIDPTGGQNYGLTHTHQLVSVPYAFYSRRAAQVQYAQLGDSAGIANFSYHSGFADTAGYATTANYSDSSNFAQIATTAHTAIHTQNSDSSASAGNGYSHVSFFGDTLYFLNGNYVIVPGISGANGGVSMVMGCTSNSACNYDPVATTDDGSCYFRLSACNDEDPATSNDRWTENCLCRGEIMPGCNDVSACNYDATATQNDGTCYYVGEACNDNNGNTANDTWSSTCGCVGQLLGCTDVQATNYNTLAQVDDGSCTYPGSDMTGCGATEVLNPDLSYGMMSDQDGNNYATIIINGREWMAENLNTTIDNSGALLTEAQDAASWASSFDAAWASSNGDISLDCPYGKLYNLYAVLNANVCPLNWHVATDADWQSVFDFYGGTGVAGAAIKSVGISYWPAPNAEATNASGFSALPAGLRLSDGSFFETQMSATWWSASGSLYYLSGSNSVELYPAEYEWGSAIRCVKNN